MSSTSSGQRGCEPRFWIWRPSFEHPRDFNPPEQRAAQRTLLVFRQSASNPELCRQLRTRDERRIRGLGESRTSLQVFFELTGYKDRSRDRRTRLRLLPCGGCDWLRLLFIHRHLECKTQVAICRILPVQ